MLITRKTKVPLHWVFYAQLPFVMSITAYYAMGAPFLFAMKKFIDNPAAITFLLSIEVFVTALGGPFCNWLSDRVWTRHGRRKPFIVVAVVLQCFSLFAMPFATSLTTLIILRWCYGVASDIASPNQALTMEIVPAKQRGMGAGFFKLQLQVVNLFFYGIILGRFDDIYFTGPLHNLLSISGETLIFFAGATMLLAVAVFTWFGIHEIEPPDRRRIRDDRRPGESMVRLFLRGFFGDVLHKSLLPLYLLLMAGTLLTVGLGTLEPLLYTDQWGYSLQDMGTNTAIGAVLGIVTALVAGWFADKTSKLQVYTTAMVLGLLGRIFWTYFVYQKPDYRPELHEIVLFGLIQSTFGMVASAASFPLILEYVERNRLGTAGAGMGFFNSTIRNGFGMFVGFYLVMWSVFFLPQAGDRVELVFREELTLPQLQEKLSAGGVDPAKLDLAALHRPGIDADSSRRWEIRRPIEEAGDLHKRLKDLGNLLAKEQLKLQRPNLAAEVSAKISDDIAGLRAEETSIRARLRGSAEEFRETLRTALAPSLAVDGHELVSLESREQGAELSLVMDFVEPVDIDISRRTLVEALTFSGPVTGRHTIPSELARVLETVDLTGPPEITPLTPERNALRIDLRRDPAIVAIESALVAGKIRWADANRFACDLIPPLRALTGSAGNYAILSPAFSLEEQQRLLRFELSVDQGSAPAISAEELAEVLKLRSGVTDVRATGTFPRFQVALHLADSFSPDEASTQVHPALQTRLRELLPAQSDHERVILAELVSRITQTAAANPVFLTATRPVPAAEPADRRYDYFFSMQFFMIATDILGLMILWLILHLEKRGVVKRVGALEDANR